jgi:hypothetical protein
MNDTDVAKQIQQMVRFIRQEADEKASEISVSAEEVSYRFSPPPALSLQRRSFQKFLDPSAPCFLAARSARRAPPSSPNLLAARLIRMRFRYILVRDL